MFFDESEDIIIIETQENRGQKTIQPELDRETLLKHQTLNLTIKEPGNIPFPSNKETTP